MRLPINVNYLIEILKNCDDNNRLNTDEDVKQCIFNTMLFSEIVVEKEQQILYKS